MQLQDAHRAAAWLFVGLVLLYVAISGGHVDSPDGVIMARTAESLVERGTFAISDPGYPPGFLTAGNGGRLYSKYGPGTALVAVPFYLLGRALSTVAPAGTEAAFSGRRFLWYRAEDRGEAWRMFGVSLTTAPLVAGSCTLLFLLVLELGFEAPTALAAAVLAGLASPLLVYAKTFFSEPLAAFGLALATWAVTRWRRRPHAGVAALAGAGLGIAVLAKVAHVVLLPVAVVAAMLALQGTAAARPLLLRSVLAAVAALGAILALLGWLDVLRFGSPFETGYGPEAHAWTDPPLAGLLGLLVSPGRGLVEYFPAGLLALAASRPLARRSPWLAVLAWGWLGTLLVLYCRWPAWDGGWCWGPRFLVPVLPLLCAAISPWIAAPPSGRAPRWSGFVLVGFSAIFNWTGTLVPFTDYHAALRRAVGGSYLAVARWSWRAFPPSVYWRLPKTYWLAVAAARIPSARWLALLLVTAGVTAVVALGRAAQLSYTANKEDPDASRPAAMRFGPESTR